MPDDDVDVCPDCGEARISCELCQNGCGFGINETAPIPAKTESCGNGTGTPHPPASAQEEARATLFVHRVVKQMSLLGGQPRRAIASILRS